jgi:type IV secretory pathway VirB3-like protein
MRFWRVHRNEFALVALYCLVACVITYPLITDLAGRLAGHPFGDSYEISRHVWWINHALRNGLPLFEQPLLLYPDGVPSAYFWGNPLQLFPAWLLAFVMPVSAAYNLSLLLVLALNGYAMYRLALRLTGLGGAAFIAGVVYCAYPTIQAHAAAGHIGIISLWSVPLLALAILNLNHEGTKDTKEHEGRFLTQRHRDTETQRKREESLTQKYRGSEVQRKFLSASLNLCVSVLKISLFFALGALGSTQMLLFATLPVVGVFVVTLAWQRAWVALARLLAALTLGSVIVALFALPALVETVNAPVTVRDEGGVVRYSADLLAVVSPSPYHPLYVGLGYPARVLGVDPFESTAYIGIVAGLLAVVGVWIGKPSPPTPFSEGEGSQSVSDEARTRRAASLQPSVWAWVVMALVVWVLSLGALLKVGGEVVTLRADGYASGMALPYAALLDVPLLDILRAPGRFNVAIAFVVALLAGYGAAGIERLAFVLWRLATGGAFPRRALTSVVCILIVYDYQFWWREGALAFPTVNAAVPAPIADLQLRDDVRAVFHVPWQHLLVDKDALWLQTGYQQPMIAGHVARRTPLDPTRGWLLQTFDPALLDAAGVDVIILHREWAEDTFEAAAREALGEPFYEDDALIAWNAPASDNPPQFRAVLPVATATTRADIYVYMPIESDVRLYGQLASESSRVLLFVDDAAWQGFDGREITLDVGLTLGAGFHTLTLTTEPTCERALDATLACATFVPTITIETNEE